MYQPISSAYVGEMPPPLPEAKTGNGPVRGAWVLIVLALVGVVAVVGWLAAWDEKVAGMVSLASLALSAGAVFLAIGGIVVAGQRASRKRGAVIALVIAVVLTGYVAMVTIQQTLAIMN